MSGRLLYKTVGGVATDYIYAGPMLVAEKQGSTVNYLHSDLLGSPIDGLYGSTSYTENYKPWGEKLDNPIPLAGDVGYTGHQSDVATGLTYMQARYYDPVVGRFMAVDPVGFTPANPMSFNRYLYVNNNPYLYTDPDGEFLDTILDIGFILYDSGQFLGASAAAAVGAVTGNDALQSAGLEGMGETGVNLSASVVSAAIPGLAAPVARGALKTAGVAADAARGGTEVVQRAMSRAELAAMRDTGLVRGGRAGPHFVSDAVNSTATRAQSRLGLPNRPDVRVTMEVPAGRFSPPSRVQPLDLGNGRVLPGGGMERSATGDIPARILSVDEL